MKSKILGALSIVALLALNLPVSASPDDSGPSSAETSSQSSVQEVHNPEDSSSPGADDYRDPSPSSGPSSGSSGSSSSGGIETEIEHGVVTTRPDDGSTSASSVDDDSGMEVEVEHGVTFLKPHNADAPTDMQLESAVTGRILLQVEKHGEAWYVDPASKKTALLGRPNDALSVMRRFGLGITDADLDRIPEADSNETPGVLAERLAGRILLQVQSHGEAWYVDPVKHKRHSLGRPEEALRVMRALGLGITDANLSKVADIR